MKKKNNPVLYRSSSRHGQETIVGPHGWFGIHMGNEHQAKALEKRMYRAGRGEIPRTTRVFYADLRKPIRLTDRQVMSPYLIAWELKERRLINEEKARTISWLNSPEDGRKVLDILISLGYDSIVYKNMNIVEGPGDSWVAFRNDQIKEIGYA